jgi:hypothetical protein
MSFNDELIRALAAKGIVIGPEGKWIRDSMFSGTNAATDEQIRFINGSAERQQSDTNARLNCHWVENLGEVVEVLNRDGEAAPWPFTSVFWTRLHGVLVDLRQEELASFRSLGVDPVTHTAPATSPLEVALTTFRCIEALRSTLTDDELIYADYRRQTEGHPTQRSYDVRWSQNKGGIVDSRRVPSLEREYTVEELDAALRRVIREYPNEAAIAVAIGRKIRGALRPLVAVMRRGASTA